MTATTVPSGLASRPRRAAPPAAARLLWIEIRRNPVLWVLPLLALLFWFDTYRTLTGYPPIWTVRATAVPDRLLVDFAALAAGSRPGPDPARVAGRPGTCWPPRLVRPGYAG
jgi:hypothetical protein